VTDERGRDPVQLRPGVFEDFYEQTWDVVYRPLAFALGDPSLAAEAVDEAMTRAFERWSHVSATRTRLQVAVAMIPVSVDGRDEDSGIWIGAQGAEPSFDTSGLGPDLSYVSGRPDPDDLRGPERADTVVYLGDVGGDPIYIYSQRPPSVWDLLSEYLFGNWSGKIYGTSLVCCSSNADVPEGGLPGVSGWMAGNESGGVAEWLALPPDAAVVAYEVDGEPLGWQRPIGRVAMIRIDFEQREGMEMTAYNADGSILAGSLIRTSPEADPSFGRWSDVGVAEWAAPLVVAVGESGVGPFEGVAVGVVVTAEGVELVAVGGVAFGVGDAVVEVASGGRGSASGEHARFVAHLDVATGVGVGAAAGDVGVDEVAVFVEDTDPPRRSVFVRHLAGDVGDDGSVAVEVGG
jgi:hypothetical protein